MPSENAESDAGRHLLALFVPLTWSGSFIAGTYATRELPPLTATLLRFAVCLVLLLPMLPRLHRGLRLRARDFAWFALLGLLCVVAYHYFFFAALKHTTASMAAIVLQTNPILINIGAAIFLGETIRWRTYAGAVVAFAGIVALAMEKGGWSIRGWGLGETLISLGALSWVAYTLIGRPVFRRHNSLLVSTYAFAIGTIALMPLAWLENGLRHVPDLSLRAWASILYMGIAANVIGYVFYNNAIKRLGAGRAALFILLVPPLTAIWDRLFFGEPVTAIKTVAIVMVLAGVWLSMSRPRPGRGHGREMLTEADPSTESSASP